jgi:hypothetical protein
MKTGSIGKLKVAQGTRSPCIRHEEDSGTPRHLVTKKPPMCTTKPRDGVDEMQACPRARFFPAQEALI